MKQRIGIDVDGVLRDFCNELVSAIKTYHPEYLKDEYWTKNIYSNLYKVNVFELVSVTYDNPEYIHVNNPVNVTYKHVNLGWISLPRSGYIQTDSIKTGSIGSCTIESDADTKFDDGSGNA